jgi:protein ERP2
MYSIPLSLLSLVLVMVNRLMAVELTFELPDSAKQCFHEEIRQGNKSTIEFQVS